VVVQFLLGVFEREPAGALFFVGVHQRGGCGIDANHELGSRWNANAGSSGACCRASRR
jgi:hypothetical protein